MPDVNEQIAKEAMKIGGNFIKGTAAFIAELLKTLDKNRLDDPNVATVFKHIKEGGQTFTSYVDNELIADMKRHLTEQNIPFVFVDVQGENRDNCKLLVIRDTDTAKAEFATKLVMAEHGHMTEFSKDEFINFTPKSELAGVGKVSLHEYERFRETARDNGLKFAATINDKNEVTILYNVNDKAKLDAAMKQMVWNMTGRNGDEYRAAYKTKVEAQEYIKMIYKKKAKPMYIVDAKNPDRIIKVDAKAVYMCHNYDKSLSKETNFEQASAVRFTEKKFVSELNEMVVQMEEPVIVSEKEFNDRDKVIQRKLPKLEKEWEDKEAPYRLVFEEDVVDLKSPKIQDRDLDDDFDFATYVVEEAVVPEGASLEELTDMEREEINQHTHETVSKIKQYDYYVPKDSVLMKAIENVRKQRSEQQARDDAERADRKRAERDAKRPGKDKSTKDDRNRE